MNADLTFAICMYNAEQYIDETLQSVINQTMQDFHLLLVDDCSTDCTVEKVKHFFSQYPRQYELHLFKENQGIAYARNFALNTSTTKYFIFIDSDDIAYPDLLKKEYTLITSDQELMAVSSWLEYIDNKGNKINGGLFIGATDKEIFRQKAIKGKRIFLPIQTMFERECAICVGGFNCEGFPEGKPRYRDFCEDLDLWTRMSDLYAEGKAIITIPEVLYKYRKANGLSSNHFTMIIKMQYIKFNVRRRRNGEKDVSFVEYYNGLSNDELSKLKRDATAADTLRNGVFYLKEHKLLKAFILISKSIWYRPSYIMNKLKSNLKLIRK